MDMIHLDIDDVIGYLGGEVRGVHNDYTTWLAPPYGYVDVPNSLDSPGAAERLWTLYETIAQTQQDITEDPPFPGLRAAEAAQFVPTLIAQQASDGHAKYHGQVISTRPESRILPVSLGASEEYTQAIMATMVPRIAPYAIYQLFRDSWQWTLDTDTNRWPEGQRWQSIDGRTAFLPARGDRGGPDDELAVAHRSHAIRALVSENKYHTLPLLRHLAGLHPQTVLIPEPDKLTAAYVMAAQYHALTSPSAGPWPGPETIRRIDIGLPAAFGVAAAFPTSMKQSLHREASSPAPPGPAAMHRQQPTVNNTDFQRLTTCRTSKLVSSPGDAGLIPNGQFVV